MVNDQIQMPVQFSGRGLVRRPSNHFEPGDYKDCVNVVLTENETLVKRPPLIGTDAPLNGGIHRFLGHRGLEPIGARYVIGDTQLYYVGENNWDIITQSGAAASVTTLLTAAAGYAGYISYEAYVQYNGRDHLVVVHTDVADTQYKVYVLSGLSSGSTSTNFNTRSWTVGDLIVHKTPWAPTLGLPSPILSSWVVHKDRLLLAIDDTVFFSKVADFTQWQVVDDGAFIKFPGKKIKKIVAIGDSIYVIFDSSVSLITYSRGPNLDAQTRVISEVIGGEDAVAYEGTVYLLKSNAIFTLSGSNIEKLLDLELGVIQPPHVYSVTPANSRTSDLQFVGYKGGLYIIPRNLRWATPANDFLGVDYGFDQQTQGIYRVDLTSGFISNYKVNAFFRLSGAGFVNCYFLPDEDNNNTQKLFFVIKPYIPAIDTVAYFGTDEQFKAVTTSHSVISFGMDLLYPDGNAGRFALEAYPIPVKVTFAALSPDTMKYFISKFRSIFLMLDAPMWKMRVSGLNVPELKLNVNAGLGSVLGSTRVLSEDLTNVAVGEQEIRSYRFGVNQRAKTVDITIETDATVEADYRLASTLETTEPTARKTILNTLMEIVDIRTMWSPTRRNSTSSTDYS